MKGRKYTYHEVQPSQTGAATGTQADVFPAKTSSASVAWYWLNQPNHELDIPTIVSTGDGDEWEGWGRPLSCRGLTDAAAAPVNNDGDYVTLSQTTTQVPC